MDLQFATTQNQTLNARSVLDILRHRKGMKLDVFQLIHVQATFN